MSSVFPKIPQEIIPILRGRRVYCGFSGGSDSLLLLHMLKQAVSELNIELCAVHFEHGLRGGESLADAQWCSACCRNENIPILIQPLNVREHMQRGEGEEAAARRLRMEAWKKLIPHDSRTVIALGHNADDRTENLFLRLFRGSNASGLTSFRGTGSLEEIPVVRPLLRFTKAEVEECLRQNEIKVWRIDSTNRETVYRRNLLRLEILPEIAKEFPFALKGIRQSLDTLEKDALFIEEKASSAWHTMLRGKRFSAIDWCMLPSALRCRVLRKFLSYHLKEDYIPDSALIERFDRAIEFPPSGGEASLILLKDRMEYIHLTKAAVSVRSPETDDDSELDFIADHDGCVLFCGKKFRISFHTPPFDPEYHHDLFHVCFDADQIGNEFHFTFWRHGDKMVPFGHRSPVSLKKLFTDRKIKTDEKNKIPVLRDFAGNPVWIPGVRHSAAAPITDSTKRVVCMIQEQTQE